MSHPDNLKHATARAGDHQHQVPGKRAIQHMILQFNVSQAEAIKRGFNAPSLIKLEVDIPSLTPKQRKIIAQRLWDGWRLDSSHPNYGLGEIPQPDLSGVIEKLDAIIADREKIQAEDQIKTQQAEAFKLDYSARLITEPHKMVRREYYAENSLVDYDYDAKQHFGSVSNMLTPEAYVVWEATLEALNQAAEAEEKAQAEKKQAEKDRVAAARKAGSDHAVATYGSDVQKQMYARGVLDTDIIEGWLQDEVFAPITLEKYQPLTEADCDYPDNCDPESTKLYFRNGKLGTLTPPQFEAVLAAEKALPGCSCEVHLHLIEDDNDSSVELSPVKYSLDVTVQHRGFSFIRSFALD